MDNKGLSAPPRVTGTNVKINTDIQQLKYIYKQVGIVAYQIQPLKCQSLSIQADHDNAGTIYLGTGDDVDATHSFRRLEAGESYGLGIAKTSVCWIIGTDASDIVRITIIDK